MKTFWSKVRKTDWCWYWTAAAYPDGRGQFRYEGRCQAAPRVAFLLERGPIPPGGAVALACGEVRCVRPDHLVLTTKAAIARRNSEQAYLTPSDESEVVRLYTVLARTTTEIAPLFGCSPALIHKALVKHAVSMHGRQRPRLVESEGYWRFDGVKLHRIIMEAWLGRSLRDDEHVHHIDGDRKNNHPDNLMVLTASEHHRLHYAERAIGPDGRLLPKTSSEAA